MTAPTPRFSPSPSPVIGVFGHYGNENLGDEAIIEALVARIRTERSDVEIRCFSIHPRDSSRRYGVAAFPIRSAGEVEVSPRGDTGAANPRVSIATSLARNTAALPSENAASRIKALLPNWLRAPLARFARMLDLARGIADEFAFLIRSYRRLRSVDALIVAGSNQFLDNFGGPWGFPYTLLKWSMLARLAGCRLFYVSVGAGPLDSRLGKLMVRMAVRVADYLSFRDAASRRLLQDFGVRRTSAVYPDLAHSLVVRARGSHTAQNSRQLVKPVVGINPMPVYDERYWSSPDRERYRRYCVNLATFAAYLVEEGHPVFLFSTQPKDINVAADIVDAMGPSLASRLLQPEPVKQPRTVDDMMGVISEADIVVATRFHGTLLSLHAHRPVLAICYHRKTRDLMCAMGQEDYAIDLDKIEIPDLVGRFHRLERHRAEETARITRIDDGYVAALEDQYRQLFALALHGRG